MNGGFIHNLNPVITAIGPVKLYYYGLAYAVGFAGIYGWFRFRRKSLGWTVPDVYDFSILFAVCVLLAGRLFAVCVYHGAYYREHLPEFLSYWQGGMATHGVLLGAVSAMVIFARRRQVSFRQLADEAAIPGAFLLALGRIGNFINGQICGTITTVWWAVKFPEMEGFRHPVTLYEAAKNLMIIAILWFVSRRHPAGKGQIAAHFVFWYGFLRLFTDIFRDHGALFLGIGRNQYFNAGMAVLGLILMVVFRKMEIHEGTNVAAKLKHEKLPQSLPFASIRLRRSIFISILLFCLVIRSAWTPAVLEQKRMTNDRLRGVDLKTIDYQAAEGNESTD